MVWQASYGGIYPNLQALTREGLLSKRVVHQEGKPDRHLYALTAKGRLVLKKWLKEPEVQPTMGPRKDTFFLKFYLSHLLNPQEFKRLIRLRLAALEEYLKFLRRLLAQGEDIGPPERFFPPTYVEMSVDSEKFFRGLIQINRFHWELIRLEALRVEVERDWLHSIKSKAISS